MARLPFELVPNAIQRPMNLGSYVLSTIGISLDQLV
jgi:hypothetical protein